MLSDSRTAPRFCVRISKHTTNQGQINRKGKGNSYVILQTQRRALVQGDSLGTGPSRSYSSETS